MYNHSIVIIQLNDKANLIKLHIAVIEYLFVRLLNPFVTFSRDYSASVSATIESGFASRLACLRDDRFFHRDLYRSFNWTFFGFFWISFFILFYLVGTWIREDELEMSFPSVILKDNRDCAIIPTSVSAEFPSKGDL